MSFINTYICAKLHGIITLDCEPREVTPASILCPICKELAWSNNYQVDQTLKPEWEWFVPKSIEEIKEACLPIFGNVFSDEDFQKMMAPDANCKVMYRKIKR